MRRLLLSSCVPFLCLLLITGCASDPVPIRYGSDVCDLCRMQIEDRGYGAELISPKGKVYRFDSGECLLRFLDKQLFKADKARHILVTDRSAPGNLIDARTASYLISPRLMSPMGEGLSAFASPDSLRAYQARYGGEMLEWEELYLRLSKH